ncbi:MAG: hypothetical protein EBE86_023810 [Hormoscilla sp. GUM202]|nr:hypothetical protein [Hormoscilla sp. GUM202]
MDINFAVIIGAFNAAKSIAEYFGLIESLGTKVDKLISVELDAAFRTLKQSQISLNEQQTLLREARASFNKAICLEKDDERLVIAYIGLSLCHYQLGDIANAKNTLV